MHELAVTTSILDLALEHTPPDAHVIDVYLVIGQLSSMIDDSVQFYWDIISQHTPAQGSRLHFRRILAQLECSACKTRYPMQGDNFSCPACGSSDVRVIAGDEFYLEAINVDHDVLVEESTS
ncbi:MAG: hydrogenase maturation nickel metallochaperone HypA [Chloroflexota bacterium]